MSNYRGTTEDKLGPLKSVIHLNNIRVGREGKGRVECRQYSQQS